MGDSIEAVVIKEFLKRERQKEQYREVQVPLELPLPLPYQPGERGPEKEEGEDGEQRGEVIIQIYDDGDDDGEKEDNAFVKFQM